MDPKIINFLTNFGAILGAILGPKIRKKGTPKWDPFLNQFWDPQDGREQQDLEGPAECAGVLGEIQSKFDRLGQTEKDELDKRVLTRRPG